MKGTDNYETVNIWKGTEVRVSSSKIFAGVDIGSTASKAVLIQDGKMKAFCIFPTGHNMSLAAREVLEWVMGKAMAGNGPHRRNLDYIVVTGYGRHIAGFGNKVISEITCHGKGAFTMLPAARTVIDIGGQDSKIIWLNERGNIVDFITNDKCAAGTGRFLEVISGSLDVKVEELGEFSLKSQSPYTVSSTCAVFAESEVVGLRSRGAKREDIIAGIHQALALRIVSMGTRRGFQREVVLSGGVAKNIGMRHALEQRIGFNVLSLEEPQLTGALGAALFAAENGA
jgi:predicted CoA-substrate-specific enzyme activase